MRASGELYTTVEDAKTELREWCEENPNTDPTDEAIHEIADSSVPVYYVELMQIAVDNPDLANTEPSNGTGDENTAVSIMQMVVYEYIEEALNDEWRVIEQEREEAELEEDEEDEPEENEPEEEDPEEDAEVNPKES